MVTWPFNKFDTKIIIVTCDMDIFKNSTGDMGISKGQGPGGKAVNVKI